MDLLSAFQKHWQDQFGFAVHPQKQFILALSGGVDSTVLAYCLHQSGISFTAAHVNYQLRGAESERDEQFVHAFCQQFQIPLLVKKIDTNAYCIEHKLSVQVAARQIRYDWFETLQQTNTALKDAWILTAHHANDTIETSMMHFFRGTGIDGLKGIPAVHHAKKILRPLLPFFKKEIEAFAKNNGLSFVEDSSNATDHYTRNVFRNTVLPAIRDLFPAVEENLFQNTIRFSEVAEVYKEAIQIKLNALMEKKGNEWHIPILKWAKTKPLNSITWEMIAPFGFSTAQIAEVVKLSNAANSSYIQSATYRMIKNRGWLIIAPLVDTGTDFVFIEKIGEYAFRDGTIKLSLEDANNVAPISIAEKKMKNATHIEWVNAALIQFPLILRQWRLGDYFYPLGMPKKKKIAKFLADAKLSKTQKEKVWVLVHDETIIALLGHRIDHRFRWTPQTKQLLKIEWAPS